MPSFTCDIISVIADFFYFCVMLPKFAQFLMPPSPLTRFFSKNAFKHKHDEYLTWAMVCMYIVLRRFLHIEAISRQKETRSRDYALLLFRMTSRVLYSARYHRQHCRLHDFEQFGALYMHNHDDKYPARPEFQVTSPSRYKWAIGTGHLGDAVPPNAIRVSLDAWCIRFYFLSFSYTCFLHIVTLHMKGCICHFVKWQIHPFISKGTICSHTFTSKTGGNKLFCWISLRLWRRWRWVARVTIKIGYFQVGKTVLEIPTSFLWCCMYVPKKTGRWASVVLMLGQRRRKWLNFNTTLSQHLAL